MPKKAEIQKYKNKRKKGNKILKYTNKINTFNK